MGFSGEESSVKNPPVSAVVDWIPGWRGSPGGGNGNPLQYSCPGRGAWWAAVHGVTNS